MTTSDEKFYAQRDANFKQRVCNILFDDSIEHSENEALELIASLRQQREEVQMLIDLNKDEISYLVDILKLNNDEFMMEEETEFSSNLYLKLRNISKACTCKADAN